MNDAKVDLLRTMLSARRMDNPTVKNCFDNVLEIAKGGDGNLMSALNNLRVIMRLAQ